MNSAIKQYAKKKHVYLWQLAEKYGITDGNLSKRLRKEFSPKEQEQAFQFIDDIAAENKGGASK